MGATNEKMSIKVIPQCSIKLNKRKLFQKAVNDQKKIGSSDKKLDFFLGECDQSFNHKNAFEIEWNETESCFGSLQECPESIVKAAAKIPMFSQVDQSVCSDATADCSPQSSSD